MISPQESKLQSPPRQRPSSPSSDDGMEAAEQLQQELHRAIQIMTPAPKFYFQNLPVELIYHILSFLSPSDLETLSLVSKTLKTYSEKDLAWQHHCQANIPGVILTSPSPYSTYRELYRAHDPHWFLTKWKVWFSDHVFSGRLVIARFNPQNGNIEAYRLVAERADLVIEQWEHDNEVMIHSFEPHVQLHFDNPILNLSALRVGPATRNDSRRFDYQRLSSEIPMRIDSRNNHGSFANFLLARKAQHDVQSSQVWPPMTIPGADKGTERVVAHDQEIYQTERHKPQSREQASEHAFRIRQWIEMTAGPVPNRVHLGEEVWTFATLDPQLYTPTREKQFRGIWIGDYSGHGCEFLLVHQPDDEVPIQPLIRDEGESDEHFAQRQQESTYRGRLEAIKLTGDPNIPRGEITFVAEDIGEAGFVRYAKEERFKGARIVHSKGHIAARTFRNDKYIDSELIMISPNRIAQYWVGFGHISFYERVNIDAFINPSADGVSGATALPSDFSAFQGAISAPGAGPGGSTSSGANNGGWDRRADNVVLADLN